MKHSYNEKSFLAIVQSFCSLTCIIVAIMVGWILFIWNEFSLSNQSAITSTASTEQVVNTFWKSPDSTSMMQEENYTLLEYGRNLIAHTAHYLGPKGKVMTITNGMNCQNCHLHAGTITFGNNYAVVASTYPKYRARSGTIESIEKRVNDCIERSLNGKALNTNSNEMKAIVAYIKWVGKEVEHGVTPKGTGIWDLTPIDRAANAEAGKLVYRKHCQQCHANGEGVMNEDGIEWKYPPLFGKHSYTIGAGLYRLSRFAGFVKMNMPYGATFENPTLTDEEAWDVAAFINSMPHPDKDISADWPDVAKKPFDHPFGPYADSFSEQQHKLGPFAPIKASQKK